jgi:2-methylcitrate dehydratase PrpD
MIAQALAKHIVKSNYNNLSDEVREVTKLSILDTLGVMFPPTTMEKACLTIYKMMIGELVEKRPCSLKQ